MIRRIVAIGATSKIAQATLRRFAEDGCHFFLIGRHPDKLRAVAEDLSTRGAAGVDLAAADLNDVGRHGALVRQAADKLARIDVAIIAHGVLPDQELSESESSVIMDTYRTNVVSVLSFLMRLAEQMEKQKTGTLAVISSVAGDRGRRSNYLYGSTKAALNIFLQGLRQRLHSAGVHVLTIKPGLVDTPMTARVKKGFLAADARSVGDDIYAAILLKKDEVYTPGFWRPIMAIIRSIPNVVFNRLNF